MGRKLTQEEFIEKAKTVHGDGYDYSKMVYINSRTNITIYCPVHDYEFQVQPNNHLVKRSGCSKCANVYKRSPDEFARDAGCVHNNKYIEYKNFSRVNSDVDIKCPIHGWFRQNASNHLHLRHGCPKCAPRAPVDLETFKIRSLELHGGKYTEFKNFTIVNDYVDIKCPTHGWFSQRAANHINLGHGCPSCAKAGFSKSQILYFAQIEASDNITIQHAGNAAEFKIPGIGKVDGYCEETSTCYEFHGDFWHGHPSKFQSADMNPVNKKTYGELYTTTLERDQKIRDLGYNLVVIWEHEWEGVGG